MDDELKKAYDRVIGGSQPQPVNDELTVLRKLNSQASINAVQRESYIKGLEQLVDDMKLRISDLERILNSGDS